MVFLPTKSAMLTAVYYLEQLPTFTRGAQRGTRNQRKKPWPEDSVLKVVVNLSDTNYVTSGLSIQVVSFF